MNKVFFIGNLTKNPDLRATASGKDVCNLSLAVNHDFVNADGERGVDYFPVKIWGERAKNCKKFLKKGSKIAVTGSIHNRPYEDENGYTRYITEVTAENIEFLSFSKDESKDAAVEETAEEVTEENISF